MVIMRPDAKEIPGPVDVDLARIVKTSTLVNFPGGDTLPSMPLIQAAINDQASGATVPTFLGQTPVGTNSPTAVSSGPLGAKIPAVPHPLGPGH